MRRWILPFWIVASGLLVSNRPRAQDIQLESAPARWRLTYEEFESEQGSDFGLVGIHYDRLAPFRRVPNMYLGVGGYGAVSGDNGGFFLAGGTVGYILPFLPRWYLDGGVFLGAGGGGSRPENEGWAVRPFLAVERALGLYGVRAEVAWFDMDEFELDDIYFAIGLTMSSEILTAREGRGKKPIPADELEGGAVRVTPRWMWLDLEAGTRTKDRRRLDDVQMVGLGVDYFLTSQLYFPVEAYGAVGGDVSGFAMAFAGLGVSLPVLQRVRLEAKASAGAGGGGDVDTGSGFGWQAQGGVRIDVSRSLAIEVLGGYLDFPDGDFQAATGTVGLSWTAHPARLAITYPRGNLAREGIPGDRGQIVGTRIYVMNKTYRPESDARKVGGGDYDSSINLAGVRFEQPLYEWFSATGAAFAAYEGNIGGYAEGLLGLKAELEPIGLEGHYFYALAETGAAGGGGVDVASGWIYNFSGGYRTQIARGVLLALEAGWFEADTGSFSGETYTVGLGVDLHRAFLYP